MKDLIKYILKDKKTYLPYIFSPEILVIFMFIFPWGKGLTFISYAPLFFYFGFRALSKAKKDLSLKNWFIILLSPVLIVFCLGLLINIIGLFYMIFKLITVGTL